MAEAILDSTKAEHLFTQVRQDMKNHLGLSTDRALPFHLVDLDGREMQGRAAGKFRSRVQYLEYQVDDNNVIRREKQVRGVSHEIVILSGLSPKEFKSVAAHELAHDIADHYFPHVVEKRDYEGFAEYLSALMNRYWKQEDMNERKLLKPREYVEGYQFFLRLEERGGLPAVLERMKRISQAK